MFDTHCHLNFDVFDGKVPSVVNNAKKDGVSLFVIPGVDIESSKRAIELSDIHNEVFASCGFHPTHNFSSINKKAIEELERLLASSDKVVAVGEIGLDSYKGKSSLRVQKEFLKKQIELAKKLNLGVILHNRETSEALIDVLKEIWTPKLSGRVVFHFVEPHKTILDFATKNRVYMGVDGDITYNKKKQEFLKKIPLDLLVLETDSPFLVPEPLRSKGVKPNEPKNVKIVANFVSKILEKDTSEIDEITTRNAKKLFNMLE